MEGLLKCDDLITVDTFNLLMVTASQLNSSLIRLCPTIAEKYLISAAILCQKVCNFVLSRNMEQVRDMPERINLILQLRTDFFRSMT
ncbi:hypothetical protein D3C87_2063200 [compost metagenome]